MTGENRDRYKCNWPTRPRFSSVIEVTCWLALETHLNPQGEFSIQLQREKTYLLIWASNEDSNLPVHPCSLVILRSPHEKTLHRCLAKCAQRFWSDREGAGWSELSLAHMFKDTFTDVATYKPLMDVSCSPGPRSYTLHLLWKWHKQRKHKIKSAMHERQCHMTGGWLYLNVHPEAILIKSPTLP